MNLGQGQQKLEFQYGVVQSVTSLHLQQLSIDLIFQEWSEHGTSMIGNWTHHHQGREYHRDNLRACQQVLV